METSSYSLAHFESMVWLVKQLAPDRIDLREHQYSPASFGSFVVLFGRGKREVQFAWDGRDAVLSIGFRDNDDKQWTHDAYVSVPNGEGLYAEIASQATSMLAV
jgi:hypothetical protein